MCDFRSTDGSNPVFWTSTDLAFVTRYPTPFIKCLGYDYTATSFYVTATPNQAVTSPRNISDTMITVCLYMLDYDRLAIHLKSSIQVSFRVSQDSDFYVKQARLGVNRELILFVLQMHRGVFI